MRSVSLRVQNLLPHNTNKQINAPNSDYQLAITQQKSSNFIKGLLGTRNSYLKITGNSHVVLINYDKALKEVGNTLKEHINDAWKKQESEVYIPALINKEIDTAVKQTGEKISSLQKDNIRKNILKKARLTNQFKNAGNLQAAAQTSIGQTTTTYLMKNNALSGFFKDEKLSRELQCEITAAATSKIADSVYEKIMGQSVRQIRKISQEEIRRELHPPKASRVNMDNISARKSIA